MGDRAKTKNRSVREPEGARARLMDDLDNLRRVFDALEDGLLITNQTRDVLYVNHLIEDLYGPWEGRKCYEYFEQGPTTCEGCPSEAVYRGEKSRREWFCPKNKRIYDIIDTLVRNPDGTRHRVEIFRDITEQKTAMAQLEDKRGKLHVRVRELSCLHATSKAMADPEAEVPRVLQEIANLLPSAMSRPGDTCVRIVLSGTEVRTSGFEESPCRMSSDIRVKDALVGAIEVYYLEDPARPTEAPFLEEEKRLIDILAGDIAGFIERRWGRMEIAEHERRLNLFLSANPDHTYLTDADGRILYANKASLDLLGLTLEEARNVNVLSLFTATDPDAISTVAGRLRAGEEVRGFDVAVHLDEATVRSFEINAIPILRDGKVVEIMNVARDVTQRKQAEVELKRQLELLRILMDTIPNPVFYKGPEGRYTGCNRAFERFIGLTQAEIIGKTGYEIAPKEVADECTKMDAELFANPGTQTYERRVKTAAGDVRDVVFNKATYAGPDGSLAGFLGVILDITDLKRTEGALRKSEEAYRRLFEEAPIALVEIDCAKVIAYLDDLRSRAITDCAAHLRSHPDDLSACAQVMSIDRANDAALRLYECATMDEFREFVVSSIRGPALEPFVGTIIALAGGNARFHAEYRTRTAKGRERYVSLRSVAVAPSRDMSTNLLVSAVDITNLKNSEGGLRLAEAQIRTYSEELERLVEQRTQRIHDLERQRASAEGIAATGRMAARIAHEINNPLAGIKNSFLLIKGAVPKDHPRFEYVDLVGHEIDRIALIIRKMFELYRDEVQPRRAISVVDSVKEVFTLLESSLRAREIKLLCNAPQEPVNVRLPVGYFSQVMFNLLSNAIEASPTSGTITVSINREASGVVIEVEDAGTGIAPEHRDLIFEPFFTTRSEGDLRGLGLGLSVSKNMIEAMGGTIAFETAVGKGTTFIVRLPWRSEDQNA